MSFRDDVAINWSASPRIIEIVSSSSEITIQDLYDTLRTMATYSEALDDPEIVDAGGKEGGVVAVTMTLFNAQLKFKDTGVPRVCKVSGGNLFAVDENGYDMSPICYSNNVTVGYAQSVAPTMVQDADIDAIKAKVDNLPADPASNSELEVAHGTGSWAGATPSQLWGHSDRRLSSRDIESEVPGDHLPSEAQVESHAADIKAALDSKALEATSQGIKDQAAGMAQLLSLIGQSVDMRALEETLAAIKGVGWSTETLKAIKQRLDEFEPAPYTARAHFRT